MSSAGVGEVSEGVEKIFSQLEARDEHENWIGKMCSEDPLALNDDFTRQSLGSISKVDKHYFHPHTNEHFVSSVDLGGTTAEARMAAILRAGTGSEEAG